MSHGSIDDIILAVVQGDEAAATRAVKSALDASIDPLTVLDDGLLAGAADVGRAFEAGTAFLPELMLAGQALTAAMDVLQPRLQEAYARGGARAAGTVVLATIQTDIHDVGKNMVRAMMTAFGFKVLDLGVDVPIRTIIKAAEDNGADLIACSALLTTSAPYLRDLLSQLEAQGLRQAYRVIVGGAAVTPDLAASIGADGTAPNAVEAAQLAQRLLQA